MAYTSFPALCGAAGAAAMALLVGPVPAIAKPLLAGGLHALCSSREKREWSIGCEAYIEGVADGLSRAGAACPGAEAHKAVRSAFLMIPREQFGQRLASDILAPLIIQLHPCGKSRPSTI